MRTRFAAIALTALAVLVPFAVDTGSLGSPARAATQRFVPVEGVKFNVARSTPEAERRLEVQIIEAINHARPLTYIKMSMFSFDRLEVARALIAARNRKVNIQVIVNGHEFPRAQQMLKKRLGSDRTRRNFFYQCKSSCRGQGDVNHSKFILFSQTGIARDVVMIGSLNMKLNGIKNQFNDLVTLNGRTALYDTLDKVFGQMARDRLAKPAFIKQAYGDKFLLYVMPFPRDAAATKATQYTRNRDPIIELLAPVRCIGADTRSGRTVIRVNMHAWDGERGLMLARRFMELHKAGCDVKIQVGFIASGIRRVFATPNKYGDMPVRSTGYDTDEDDEIDLYSHQKVLLIRGRYGEEKAKTISVTGSSNYQNGGQYGDELIFAMYSPGLYKQYITNWDLSWKYYTHGILL